MVEHFQDYEFTIFVALVLEDLLDSDCLASFSDDGLEHDSKRTISDYFLSVVSEGLLLLHHQVRRCLITFQSVLYGKFVNLTLTQKTV